jgi:hypothetical protein
MVMFVDVGGIGDGIHTALTQLAAVICVAIVDSCPRTFVWTLRVIPQSINY